MTPPPRKKRIKGTGSVPRAAELVPLLLQQAEKEGSRVADPAEAGASPKSQGTVPKYSCLEPPETPAGAGRAGIGATGDLRSARALHKEH